MSRLRLNQELRNKISSRWRVHAEQEETVNELAEYKQYEEDMQSQIKTDLEEVHLSI